MSRLLGGVTHQHPLLRAYGNPPRDCVKPLFITTPGQIRTGRVAPFGALADRFLFSRGFAFRLLPHQPDFPTDATLLDRARLPHLLPFDLAIEGNATALLFSRCHRYSLAATGYIGPV